jgi:hypothetical protein
MVMEMLSENWAEETVVGDFKRKPHITCGTTCLTGYGWAKQCLTKLPQNNNIFLNSA